MRKSVQTEGAPQKKKHRCLTCLIVCLVLLVVLTAAIIGASAIVFNKMVSPMIGGVKFGQALSLLSGALHANEKKIVTDGYSEQDLDDFYAELNSKTYQTVKSDTQLEQEYNALPLEEQDAMTLTEYKEKNRYTITVGKILDAVGGIQDLIEGGNNTTGQPEEDTATAEDVEEGESGNSNPLADNEMLTKLLEQLNFDFSPLANYDYRSDVEDENQTTFRVTGKQVAALIGDVLREVLGSLDLSKYLEAVSSNADISTLDLTKYINIPQVTFEYTEQDPGETATEEQKQSYLKSVRLAVTLKMDFNGLLKAPEIKKLVETVAEEMIPIDMAGKGFVGKLALNAVRMFLPKKMFVTAAIYPLDADRDMEVKINNYSEKNQKAMTTIIDHFAVEDENGNKRDLFGTGVEGRGMMGQLNAYVVKAIDGIHDIVPLEFVDSKSGAQLKLAHIQMLLSLMGLYKADDLEHSITPHMFMTTLRCLLDAAEAQPIYGDLSALYQELEDKYGIDHTYWEERSLLDTEAMDDLVNQIDVTRITFNENELMKVNVYQDQLASLISDALQKGLLTGGETAAAGDEEESGSPDLLKLISFDSLEIASVDAQLDHTDFRMSAWASIDVAKLLGEFIKEESAIINSLTEALPKGLCFALSVYVRDTWDLQGNVHHTVGKIDLGDGAFVNETGICINKFDQYYTSRVLETIKLMISTLGGGEDSFDISTLSDTIEDAFRQVFEAIEDNLYCSIDLGEETVSGVKKGKMLLPSLYEVVRGLSIQQVNENASLSMDDVLSLGEIREVFRTLYNYQGSPEQYDADAADDFLSDLEAKYYLTEHWTVDDVMNGNVTDRIGADSIDFGALYRDTRPVSSLNVGISGDALADLIGRSGKLDDLDFGSGDDSVIKGIEMVNCAYSVEDGEVYLEFICRANLSASESAAAGDDSGLSIDKLLPRNIYVTGKTLINRAGGYHEDGVDDGLPVRFASSVLINDNARSVELISKLLKVFGDSSIETDTFTTNISDSMRDTFADIESNINLVYGNDESNALSLANIYNTINKNSHKDDDVYNAQSQAAKEADDQKLADLMREVGRNPEFETGTDDREGVVTKLEVSTFDPNLVYGKSDEDAFFADINDNFYIAHGQEITAQSLNEDFEINNDTLDFHALYADDRDYDLLRTSLTNKRFAALANALYTEGITVDDIGVAKILQVSISGDEDDKYIQLLVQVHVTETGDTAKILPEYLYITSVTSLTSMELGVKTYETTCQINNLTYGNTGDFIDRINLLKTAFDLDFNLSMDTITKPIADNIKDLFEEKMEPFGTIEIADGKIILPTVFSFLVDGSYADKEVQSDYVMYAMDEDGYCYLSDKEVYLDGSDWRYSADDSLYAGDSSKIIFFNKQGIKHYFPQEGRVDRVEEMIDDGHGNMVTTHVLYLSGTANEVNADSVLKQDPEILMYSLREFGKADSVAQYEKNIYIWKDHAPSTLNDRYNTNSASEDEETAFYQRLQGFYFFQETPDNTWFDSSSNIFDRLTGSNFESSFNLNGSTDTRTYSTLIEAPEIDALEAHYSAGLYHYLGDRKQVLMTDRAMGALVNKQNVLAGSGLPDNIQTMTVTAFEISVDPDPGAKIMTIEITTEVIAKGKDSEHAEQSGEALPTKFYITTTTVRNDNLTGSARYSTGVSINGMQPKDVKRMLNNIGVLSSFDLSSQLDLDKIAKNVEDALKELLDQKLDKYVDRYVEGGMLFHSVYRQVVNNLGYDITQYSYDEAIAEEDVQQIIVKLHNVTAETSFNEQSSTHQTEYDTANIIPQWIRTTDKAFGNSLSQMIEADPAMGDYIDIKQAVFFTGDYSARAWDSTHWEFWEDMIEQRSTGFAFGSDTYIAVSAKVNINFDSNVKFVPGNIHVTLVIDESKHGLANPLLFDDVIINDLTAREQLLLMSSITDNGGKLTSAKADMIAKIQQAFATLYVAGYNISYEQANSVQDWVGVLVATKQ